MRKMTTVGLVFCLAGLIAVLDYASGCADVCDLATCDEGSGAPGSGAMSTTSTASGGQGGSSNVCVFGKSKIGECTLAP